jgi:hypothetical protein
MENQSLPELQRLLAQVSAVTEAGGSETVAAVEYVQAAQNLGSEVATGASYTKLIAAIEAEIAKQNIDS